VAKRKWIRVGFDLKPLESAEPPRWAIDTKEKAVAHMLKKLSPEDRARVRETKPEDVILFHLGWGMGVRKELGLWGQNVHLLRDLSPNGPIHADDASMILIRAVWERLRSAPEAEPGAVPDPAGT
jgi:hypothetical protein